MTTDLEKNIKLLRPRIQFWETYDKLLFSIVKDLLDRAETTNASLASHIAALVQKTSNENVDVERIKETVLSSDRGIESVESFVEKNNPRRGNLMALFGVVRSNMLVADKLRALLRMIESSSQMYAEGDGVEMQRQKLMQFGLKMQAFWLILDAKMTSSDEKKLIKDIVDEVLETKLRKAS